jgi:Polyketide cyclase / dehydrase and lipid transport
MRFIKLAVISAIVLSTIIFLISLLLPANIRVSRAIDIRAPKSQIIPLLKDMQQWDNWNEYVKQLPDSGKTVNSSSVKSPSLNIIIRNVSDSLLQTEWEQGGKKFNSAYFLFESNGTTVVQWYFDFHLGWLPWQKISGIVYDKQIGPNMETSLAKLKQIAETNQ